MWKNTVVPNGRHVAAWHMHVECLLPQAMNTLTTYNTYCFSTAVVVTWVHLSDRLHIHPLFCLHFVLNIGFRTILHQSLFDIGKVSGFIPDVTRCGGLNNCVCLCVCICVCVCVCARARARERTCVCVWDTFLISECSSVELFIVHHVSCLCIRIVRNLSSNRIIMSNVTGEHGWNKSRKWYGKCNWGRFHSQENWWRGHANIFWAED